MSYKTIFDISQKGYPWDWLFYPAVLCAVFLIILIFRKRISSKRRSTTGILLFASFGFVFCVILGAIGFYTTYSRFEMYQSAIQQGNALLVEGQVENFTPKLTLGRGSAESFYVNGVRFSYTGYGVEMGFNQTKAQDGPIEVGLPVKIYYLGNDILRLEVAEN